MLLIIKGREQVRAPAPMSQIFFSYLNQFEHLWIGAVAISSESATFSIVDALTLHVPQTITLPGVGTDLLPVIKVSSFCYFLLEV